MIKTITGAQRYNKRMFQIFEDGKHLKRKVAYENAFDLVHKANEKGLYDDGILKPESKEAQVLVLLSQLIEQEQAQVSKKKG